MRVISSPRSSTTVPFTGVFMASPIPLGRSTGGLPSEAGRAPSFAHLARLIHDGRREIQNPNVQIPTKSQLQNPKRVPPGAPPGGAGKGTLLRFWIWMLGVPAPRTLCLTFPLLHE